MEFPFLLSAALLVTVAVVVAAIFFYFHGDHRPAKQSGSLSELIKNSHRFLDWTTELLAASPTATVTTFAGVITANPSNVEHILKTRFDNYPKGDRFISVLEDFLGHGIFNSDGEHWKLQRKTASIEFSTKAIRGFVMDVVGLEISDRLLPLLSTAAAAGGTIDLQEVFESFAFDNVCRVVFDEDPACLGGGSGEGSELARAFEEATNLSVQRFKHAFQLSWKLMRWLGIGSERRLKNEIVVVRRFAMRVIRSRRAAVQSEQRDDLLSRFMAEGNYSDEFLRDIIISFLLAGRDSTSAVLTWFFWLISTRPAVVRRIQDEIRQVRSRSRNRAMFTLDEVREMDYLHAALSETLRLYPAVPLETRCCAADDSLPDGTTVKKGWTVMYNSYAMGRMESIWGKDYGKYRPERWMENGGFTPKNPFRFPVFHAGPRTCLGKEMAYIQMKAVAASVMERFDIVVVDREREREHELRMMLRVKGGLLVRAREKPVEGATAA